MAGVRKMLGAHFTDDSLACCAMGGVVRPAEALEKIRHTDMDRAVWFGDDSWHEDGPSLRNLHTVTSGEGNAYYPA
jgi:hypothetical protein